MTARGILYITWGKKSQKLLSRSIKSVRQYHLELPIHVARLPSESNLLDKAQMFELSPFDETLFLDADTVILGRLDYAFKKAIEFGLACSICECPWARRYGGLQGDMIEYNTGVLFFTQKAEPLFNGWKKCVKQIDSSITLFANGRIGKMSLNDQAGFALAAEQTGFAPFVLPYNWNFRPRWHKSFFGPIKIWHDYSDVTTDLYDWNRNQSDEREIVQYTELSR